MDKNRKKPIITNVRPLKDVLERRKMEAENALSNTAIGSLNDETTSQGLRPSPVPFASSGDSNGSAASYTLPMQDRPGQRRSNRSVNYRLNIKALEEAPIPARVDPFDIPAVRRSFMDKYCDSHGRQKSVYSINKGPPTMHTNKEDFIDGLYEKLLKLPGGIMGNKLEDWYGKAFGHRPPDNWYDLIIKSNKIRVENANNTFILFANNLGSNQHWHRWK